MKLKALFMVQGALLIILGLLGLLAGESTISGWGIEVTPDLLTLNRSIALSTLTLGVIVFRIPAWVGNNLRGTRLNWRRNQHRLDHYRRLQFKTQAQ